MMNKEIKKLRQQRVGLRRRQTDFLKLSLNLEQLQNKYLLLVDQRQIAQQRFKSHQQLLNNELIQTKTQILDLKAQIKQKQQRKQQIRAQINCLSKSSQLKSSEIQILSRQSSKLNEKSKQSGVRLQSLMQSRVLVKQQIFRIEMDIQEKERTIIDHKFQCKKSDKKSKQIQSSNGLLKERLAILSQNFVDLQSFLELLLKKKIALKSKELNFLREVEVKSNTLQQLKRQGQVLEQQSKKSRAILQEQIQRQNLLTQEIQQIESSLKGKQKQAQQILFKRKKAILRHQNLLKENRLLSLAIQEQTNIINQLHRFNSNLVQQLRSFAEADQLAKKTLSRSQKIGQLVRNSSGVMDSTFRQISHIFSQS